MGRKLAALRCPHKRDLKLVQNLICWTRLKMAAYQPKSINPEKNKIHSFICLSLQLSAIAFLSYALVGFSTSVLKSTTRPVLILNTHTFAQLDPFTVLCVFPITWQPNLYVSMKSTDLPHFVIHKGLRSPLLYKTAFHLTPN